MKNKFISLLVLSAIIFPAIGQGKKIETSVMSDAYWKLWNPEVQSKIDRDIEQYRKADAVLNLDGIAAGTEIMVEQLTHDFFFGAHIFNFDQLGKDEYNRRYKELYGTLFNSATIAFYWRTFEPEPGNPRFEAAEQDTADFWNRVAEPNGQPHWRRPATDPVVAFCEEKGIRMHGHPLIWGTPKWHHPDWLMDEICPEEERERLQSLGREKLKELSPAELEALAPGYAGLLGQYFDKRIVELAEHYRGRIDSWDVVNESATDFGLGRMIPGAAICKSHYGLLPGDYTFRAFKTAERVFPEGVDLCINDYVSDERYLNQVKDLQARGCRIDVMGSQMHLMKPQQCLDIAAGIPIESPDKVWEKMDILGRAGLPVHLSEITITAPGNDARGRQIQAVIARNLYRLWFSIKPMMGITWWNVVDGCGAPGEPTISGLFTRDMQPKPAYHALDALINHEWKTNLSLIVGNEETIRFRGFKGQYRVTYRDASGEQKSLSFHLSKDGDGIDLADK